MASTSAAGGAGGVAGKKPRMGGASSLGIAPGPRGPPEEAPGTTLAHQDELPSLPLPPLRDTLARYLRSVQPLCTPEELKATTALVEDFGRPGGEGERLHAVLAEKASRERNWLIDWWNRAAYLAWGEPMAPQEATAFGPVPGLNVSLSQVQRAAMAIQGVAEYHRMVQEGRLPVLRVRGVKTCMAQFGRLMGGCRIPGAEVDEHVFREKAPRHIVVGSRGSLYVLEVLDEDNLVAPLDMLEAHLKWILTDAERRAEEYVLTNTSRGGRRPSFLLEGDDDAMPPVALLTSMERRRWYRARCDLLAAGPQNEAALRAVESALIVLSLPSKDARPGDIGLLHTASTGPVGATEKWFDKSYQLCVFPDGRLAGSLEHGFCDGVPSIILGDVINDFSAKAMSLLAAEAGSDSGEAARVLGIGKAETFRLRQPTRIKFELNAGLLDEIGAARRLLQRRADEFDMVPLMYTRYGKQFIRAAGCSPDAWFQAALQIAQLRVHHELVATYESVGITKFVLGRTETCRSVTPEMAAFALAAVERKAPWSAEDVAALRPLFLAATKAHVQYCIDAASFKAVDRPLLGYRMAAAEMGRAAHGMFSDPVFARTCTWRLSTSHLPPGGCATFVCFRAVEKDGTGVWYATLDEHCRGTVTTDGRCPDTDAATFRDNIVQALDDMRALATPAKGKL